jgi:hypothetical protein
MIDRICGIYPAHQVSRNTMKATWGQDTYLLSADVEDARRVMPLVEEFGKIPSLPEMKRLFGRLFNENLKLEASECTDCDSTGWDTGMRTTFKGGVYEIIHDYYTEASLGRTYTVVRPCQRCNVIVRK